MEARPASHSHSVRSTSLRKLTGGSLICLAAFEARVRDLLAHRYGAHTGFRQAATQLIESLKANGGNEEKVVRLLSHIVSAEAAQGDLDRVSMVTGGRPSDQMINEIRTWVRMSFPARPLN